MPSGARVRPGFSSCAPAVEAGRGLDFGEARKSAGCADTAAVEPSSSGARAAPPREQDRRSRPPDRSATATIAESIASRRGAPSLRSVYAADDSNQFRRHRIAQRDGPDGRTRRLSVPGNRRCCRPPRKSGGHASSGSPRRRRLFAFAHRVENMSRCVGAQHRVGGSVISSETSARECARTARGRERCRPGRGRTRR